MLKDDFHSKLIQASKKDIHAVIETFRRKSKSIRLETEFEKINEDWERIEVHQKKHLIQGVCKHKKKNAEESKECFMFLKTKMSDELDHVREIVYSCLSEYLKENPEFRDEILDILNQRREIENSLGFSELVLLIDELFDMFNAPKEVEEAKNPDPIKEPDISLSKTPSKAPIETSESSITIKHTDSRIFIVHGHDNEMKEAVSRVLEHLGLKPVILHEQANQGRTIIEKISDYSNVDYAIVLLSPDDKGYPSKNPEKVKSRARQNVILELGFFLGKLSRKKVFILHKKDEEFEMPSDYTGVIYTPYDVNEGWKVSLLRELLAAGYEVNAKKILSR